MVEIKNGFAGIDFSPQKAIKKKLKMIKKLFFIGNLILILSSFFTFSPSAFLEASAIEIFFIAPNTGSSASPTPVSIEGVGFTPTPKVSLYGGGLYI